MCTTPTTAPHECLPTCNTSACRLPLTHAQTIDSHLFAHLYGEEEEEEDREWHAQNEKQGACKGGVSVSEGGGVERAEVDEEQNEDGRTKESQRGSYMWGPLRRVAGI